MDVNDNAPVFRNLPQTVRIVEDSEFRTPVYRVTADDVDTLAGRIVLYTFLNVSVMGDGVTMILMQSGLCHYMQTANWRK